MAAAEKQPLADALEGLERELISAHKPRPILYWADLLACVVLGWSAFALAVSSWGGFAWAAFGVATFALYRAALFIHELAHLSARAVPGFTVAWDLLAGFPLLAPSLMYVGSHGEHHKTHLFGTADDPEYAPLAHWSLAHLALSSLGLALVPAALVLRWGLLVPLGWIAPGVKRFARERLSTLVINAGYKRKPPLGKLAKRWRNEELACALVVWGAAGALALGALPWRALTIWYALVATILMINHARTLGAHRYENTGATMTREAQVADSLNVWGPAWLRPLSALVAPVGLRFHALHHLLPTLPYHALGAVHRRLSRELPADAPYRATQTPALALALRDLAVRIAR